MEITRNKNQCFFSIDGRVGVELNLVSLGSDGGSSGDARSAATMNEAPAAVLQCL